MQVEVDLGTVSDHSIIFRGEIYKVEGGFPDQAVPTLKLVAYDRSVKMGLKKQNRVWSNTTLEGIVKDIAKAYFNPADIKIEMKGNPSFGNNGIRQQDETDLAFLLRLASTYGCEMYVLAGGRKDQLFYKAQYCIMKSTPQVTLYYGRSGVTNRLLSFQATTDVSKIQLPRVFAGIDFEKGSKVQKTTAPVIEVGTLTDRFRDENITEYCRRYPEKAASISELISAAGVIQQDLRKQLGIAEREVTSGFVTQADLKVKSDNQFSTSIYGMQASGNASGNHRIHAQMTMDIAGVGGRFSGAWYVSQVRHVVNQEGYQTEFHCQR
jgi:hypothetical protein